jgi:hypothetical protein
MSDKKKKYHTGTIHVDCMPFCTSCGKEVPPGKKFCEYCGAPLEQPAAAPPAPAPSQPVPPVTVPPQVAPAAHSGGSGKTKLIAGIIVVLIIIAGAWFIGLPLIRGTSGTGPAHQQATSLPTLPATQFPATPTAEITAAPAAGTTPAAGQTYEEKYTQTYTQVYAVNQAFLGGQKIIYTQNLVFPPLYIKFNITPKMFYEERPVEIGLASEHIANISYPSQDAWFKVQVYDADNGELKEEQGFNKGYGITSQQEFMVRAPGNYRVEMSGNDVIAEVRILTGKS